MPPHALDSDAATWIPLPDGVPPAKFGQPFLQHVKRKLYFDPATHSVHAKVYLGPECEGPPGHVHGGCQASLLDEMMGTVCWLNGFPVLAANINVDFLDKLPLGTAVSVTTKVENVSGKKVTTRGSIICSTTKGRTYSSAQGLFIVSKEFYKKLGSLVPPGALDNLSPEMKKVLEPFLRMTES